MQLNDTEAQALALILDLAHREVCRRGVSGGLSVVDETVEASQAIRHLRNRVAKHQQDAKAEAESCDHDQDCDHKED